MKKATWYYPPESREQIPADVEDMVGCGMTTVLCNSSDPAMEAMSAALEGEPTECHAEMSLAALHLAATGIPPGPIVVSDPEAFGRRFPGVRTGSFECWSGVHDAAPMARYLEDFAGRYPFVRGISLDVVRFANTAFQEDFPCDCADCRARREPWLGRGTLTEKDRRDPSVMFLEIRSKGEVISHLVSGVSAAVHGLGLRLSIAARTVYVGRDEEYRDGPTWGYGPAVFEGQDWAAWLRNGWLDDIHFMNYSPDMGRFERLCRSHQRLTGKVNADRYEGIGVSSSAGKQSPEMLGRQIDLVRDLGFDGVTIFSWAAMSPEHMEVLGKA